MENTGRFELPLITPQQAQKHVTHNEALTLVDGLMHLAVRSFGQNSPPPSVEVDDAFVVGVSPVGDWYGHAGKLAFNTAAGWRFVLPRLGMVALDLASGTMVLFDQAAWTPLGDALEISSLPSLGINTASDSLNRFSARTNAALLTAVNAGDGGNGDIQVKLNKEESSGTGSLLFQTGFSGRAEIGLAGNDDLSIKVSPNGSGWVEALRINNVTGQITVQDGSIDNSAMTTMASARIKGRVSAGNGVVEDLTSAEATSILSTFTAALKGLVPASGGGSTKYLRADGIWAAPVSGTGSTVVPGPDRYYAFSDCLAAVNQPEWTFAVAGTGASHSIVDFADANSIGAVRLALGTTAAGRGSISSPNFNHFQLGQGNALFACRIRLNTLPDATNTWVLRSGFVDSVTAESMDGVFFRYAHAVNGGKFQAVARNNNAETTADTGISAAVNTTYKLEVEVNAAGTSAEFRINGAVVATVTNDIPTGAGRETGFALSVVRTAGTASVNTFDCDYVLADLAFDSGR